MHRHGHTKLYHHCFMTKTLRSYLQTLCAVVPAAAVGAARPRVVAEAQSVKAQHSTHAVTHQANLLKEHTISTLSSSSSFSDSHNRRTTEEEDKYVKEHKYTLMYVYLTQLVYKYVGFANVVV